MRKRLFPLISLLLCVSLLFSGCGLIKRFVDTVTDAVFPSFENMPYTRPTLESMEVHANKCIALAEAGKDLDGVLSEINSFSMELSHFSTNFALSYIHYNLDTSNEKWKQEHDYCQSLTTQAEALRDKLMRALAKSPLRPELEENPMFGPGFFDDYDGESLWTEEFTTLMDQESALQAQYYDQLAENDVSAMEQTFVDMVLLRQQIAAEAGYADYPSFAYDFYFQRDYTPEDIWDYTEQIKQTLSPLYAQMFYDTSWYESIYQVSSQDTYAFVEQTAKNMGGSIAQAFDTMAERQLYHIAPGEHKLQASFEIYLPDYMAPFVFVCPTETSQDYLSFVHEFGHFCQDYATYGAKGGVDVPEIFSQAMEYLSLEYGPENADCEKMKMFSALSVYVEQAAYARFELEVYNLSAEELTAENVRQLFQQTCQDFGTPALALAYFSYTSIVHFFISPMYVISYVVSNDAAMQIYQLELKKPGAGLQCYMENLSTTEPQLMAFLKDARLESPFRPGRLEEVRSTLASVLSQGKA